MFQGLKYLFQDLKHNFLRYTTSFSFWIFHFSASSQKYSESNKNYFRSIKIYIRSISRNDLYNCHYHSPPTNSWPATAGSTFPGILSALSGMMWILGITRRGTQKCAFYAIAVIINWEGELAAMLAFGIIIEGNSQLQFHGHPSIFSNCCFNQFPLCHEWGVTCLDQFPIVGQ